jgi:CRISPR-associated Cas5-like protein
LHSTRKNTIEFRVWGRYAMFTDPLTRVGGEKCSYHLPTFEALKGIEEHLLEADVHLVHRSGTRDETHPHADQRYEADGLRERWQHARYLYVSDG